MKTTSLKTLLGASLSLAGALAFGSFSLAHAAEYDMPRLLVIGTPGTSSGSFASTNGWGPTLQKDLGINVRVVPEDSEVQRHRRLTERRDLALSSVSAAEMRFQIQGIGHYGTMTPVPQRVIWHHNDTPWGFVVSGDSDLHSMDDLKQGGLKVAQGQFSPPMIAAVRDALPAYLGMTPEEGAAKFRFVPASSYVENCRTVTEGRADVAYCATVSSVMAEMEGAPGGIRWLPMDLDNAQAWAGFLEHRPMVVPGTINMGVSSAKGVDGLASNFLYAAPADVDEEFAYRMAKWFHQSFDQYKGSHPLSTRMSLDVFREYLDRSPLPVHEGTVRYLKEINVWTEEDEQWNQEAIQKMDSWVAARKAALAEAQASGIKPNANDEQFMAIVQKHTQGLEGFRTRL
ncbi:MAG TPA: TAXI family TRAP transporter solute-binding subunit [Pseudomonas xinjiangensis]|uniref:TAXI family TRAP transporter solute-binding subunit n=2 Tax=root TaxID=1 RepID=A0A7V1BL28_9GAMM|nr:TAXI family TRAP transporter solute-binding subunit [Halopseudomonas xinjiangensis]HEC48269.1 TAXI family TRAP transporter solute-binding subunit [Halopseudomonas xinjiangensis]